jgi:hypothetical protein
MVLWKRRASAEGHDGPAASSSGSSTRPSASPNLSGWTAPLDRARMQCVEAERFGPRRRFAPSGGVLLRRETRVSGTQALDDAVVASALDCHEEVPPR